MDQERTEAIRAGFANVESDWRAYFRTNLVTGDARFAVTAAKVGAEEMVLRVRNTGSKVGRRIQGDVDLTELP
jgi:hypothetical protein